MLYASYKDFLEAVEGIRIILSLFLLMFFVSEEQCSDSSKEEQNFQEEARPSPRRLSLWDDFVLSSTCLLVSNGRNYVLRVYIDKLGMINFRKKTKTYVYLHHDCPKPRL